MPRNVYWELYYHMVWRTKDSTPLLKPEVEPLTYKYLIHRVLQTSEAMVHAVGGIEDHVHMAVSLPPTVEIAKWVGDIKGACSHEINHGPCGLGSLAWQTGYGVVSFGKRDLPWVVDYIRRQREHHAAGRVEDRLERITQIELPSPEGVAYERASPLKRAGKAEPRAESRVQRRKACWRDPAMCRTQRRRKRHCLSASAPESLKHNRRRPSDNARQPSHAPPRPRRRRD